MVDYGPKREPGELEELAVRFLSLLPDEDFQKINSAYPIMLNAPERWFRQLLDAEARRRKGLA